VVKTAPRSGAPGEVGEADAAMTGGHVGGVVLGAGRDVTGGRRQWAMPGLLAC
jgi:hypothetical protein